MSITDNLYHPPAHPFETRLVSREVDANGNPLVEVQDEEKKGKKILVLKFIRSKKPEYTFDKLLNDVLCYGDKNGYDYVKLEDDALFTMNGDCMVRALIYRAFQNKNSIYVDRGFYPENKDVELGKLKDVIYNYRIEDARNLAMLFPSDIQEVITTLDVSKNNERFGEWLLSRDCSFYRNVINRIEVISRKIETDEQTKSSVNSNTHNFLSSFRTYYLIHQNLVRNAECQKGGKRRKSRLRRTAKLSQRKHRKYGKTRKNYRNNKVSKHTRRRFRNKKMGISRKTRQ